MALAVRIVQCGLEEPFEDEAELVASFDAPRIVIGRAPGCDLMLPDPTVSGRHATVRQRNAGYVIVDEGSTNGILVGTSRLSAQTPGPVHDGQIVRVGRCWLELRTGVACAASNPSADALARLLVRRQLLAAGEPVSPLLRVVDGPDVGASWSLEEAEREYVAGRSQQSDWVLGDSQLSRRHLGVVLRGAQVLVWDLNSKRGSSLDGTPLSSRPTLWRPGQRVAFGQSVVELSDPVPEALAELLASPDQRMRTSEFADVPPKSVVPGPEGEQDGFEDGEPGSGSESPSTAAEGDSEADGGSEYGDSSDGEADDSDDAERAGGGGGLFEVIVVLVALAVIGLSVLGLLWLLRR